MVDALLAGRVPDKKAMAAKKPLHKAVHLVSSIKPNDPALTKVLDEAAESLKAGDDVVIAFDGQSVGALRMVKNKTPLESARFTADQRKALGQRLGVKDAPADQLAYVQYLAKAGAKVLANASAVKLLGVKNTDIHSVAKLVPVHDVEQAVDQADACYNYEHD
jgi:hypothetical protein